MTALLPNVVVAVWVDDNVVVVSVETPLHGSDLGTS